MKHVVSLSGGTASAVAADRVLERYGHSDVSLWFADTSWEDEGLYQFLKDLETFWEKKIIRFRDGRIPLEVAEQKRIIPNQRRAPCALELKIKPFVKFLHGVAKPVTVHLGLDWTESHRAVRPRKEYEGMAGVTVDLPLMWEPLANPPHRKAVERWGIKIPRLYDLGFPHNNCGGRCVKQGIAEWVRLKTAFPNRFEEVKNWEAVQRAKGGARSKFAIARNQSGNKVVPLPLEELERRYAQGQQLFLAPSQEDVFGCVCSY